MVCLAFAFAVKANIALPKVYGQLDLIIRDLTNNMGGISGILTKEENGLSKSRMYGTNADVTQVVFPVIVHPDFSPVLYIGSEYF